MKSVHSKTCCGSTIEIHHDSSQCVNCLRTNFFYNEFQPILAKLKRVNNYPSHEDYNVIGIITFLEACFYYDSISDEEINYTLPDNGCKTVIFPSSKDSHKQRPINYTKLLDSIIFVKKKITKDSSKVIPSYSTRASRYKYKKISKNCAEVQQSYKRKADHLEDSTKGHTLKKNKIEKPKTKNGISENIPSKGSLKRKRWLLNKLSQQDDYEDDIFEDRPFYRLSDLDEVSSSSSDYSNMGTPTWCFALSPRAESPTPEYDDCYNVTELRLTRKDAEEYQHRRKKRRQKYSKKKNSKCEPIPEDIKAEEQFANLSEPSCSYSSITNPLKDEEDYDSEEIPDVYFTDSDEEKKSNGHFW